MLVEAIYVPGKESGEGMSGRRNKAFGEDVSEFIQLLNKDLTVNVGYIPSGPRALVAEA
jgi:hypothetical protein